MHYLVDAARSKKLDRITIGYTVGAWAAGTDRAGAKLGARFGKSYDAARQQGTRDRRPGLAHGIGIRAQDASDQPARSDRAARAGALLRQPWFSAALGGVMEIALRAIPFEKCAPSATPLSVAKNEYKMTDH